MKKKTELKPNIRLLRRIQRAILKRSDQFVMSALFNQYLDNDRKAGGCGTAGCIAGWALHLASGNKTLDKTREESKRYVNRSLLKKAGDLIGIKIRRNKDGVMFHPLFFAHLWPAPFQSQYDFATNSRSVARIASARIEHYIKTGE